jgi:hypothetical protein
MTCFEMQHVEIHGASDGRAFLEEYQPIAVR